MLDLGDGKKQLQGDEKDITKMRTLNIRWQWPGQRVQKRARNEHSLTAPAGEKVRTQTKKGMKIIYLENQMHEQQQDSRILQSVEQKPAENKESH